jgi:hypothetical protein
MLKNLINKHDAQLQVSVFFNVNNKIQHLLKFVKTITSIGKNNSNKYHEAMDNWYATKDDQKWLGRFSIADESMHFNNQLSEEQHKWFMANDFNFTPCLFINGYSYPKGYKIEELPFFINELIEDSTKLAETEKL